MPLRTAATFLLRALALYALLMAPWPGVASTYAAVFRSACGVFDGPVGRVGRVTLAPAGAGDRRDTLFVLQKVGSQQVVRNGVNSRYTGYLPTVLVVALVVATPLDWARRGRALGWGLLAIHAFIGFRVAVSVYADFLIQAGVALADVGAMARALLGVFTELISDPVTSVVAAIVVWILVTFRQGDRALLAPGAASEPRAEGAG